MDKLWLIIKREYLTRVRKRSFILATLLTPIAFALFFVIVHFIFSYESDDGRKIAIIDKANIFQKVIKDERNMYFRFENKELDVLKTTLKEKDYDGILVIPELKDITDNNLTIYYYSDDQIGLDLRMIIERKVRRKVRDFKIQSLELNKEKLEALDTKVTFNPEPIDEDKKDESTMTAAIAAVLGGTMGMIMYMTVFIYGMMVMRSVMEEKTNRIVEIMISSVKPFQLMMGKIIGVGAVGLTQVAIWAVLIPAMSFLVQIVFGFDSSSQLDIAAAGGGEIDMEEMQFTFEQIWKELLAQKWWLILPLFVFYFLGGYFLYSSLFAAVGSAMGDDLGEGQALTIPITIPVIIALYIMIVALRAPHSSLAIWSSIFPLFSPIVMPARLAFDPPFWQIALSMVTLIASSIFFVWLSGRIYRVGILMYGKKVTFRELGRWLFYKE